MKRQDLSKEVFGIMPGVYSLSRKVISSSKGELMKVTGEVTIAQFPNTNSLLYKEEVKIIDSIWGGNGRGYMEHKYCYENGNLTQYDRKISAESHECPLTYSFKLEKSSSQAIHAKAEYTHTYDNSVAKAEYIFYPDGQHFSSLIEVHDVSIFTEYVKIGEAGLIGNSSETDF